MLHDIEIYDYKGEWIMIILNSETSEVEWCACNYRTYADLDGDLNEIRNLTTLEELHSFKPTIPNDKHTADCMKELKYKADVVRRALHNKQDAYMYDFNQLYFEESHERDIQIVVYNNNSIIFSIVVLNHDNKPIWIHGGYRDFGKVMLDVRRIQQLLNSGHDIERMNGYGIECDDTLHPAIDFFINGAVGYYEYLELGVRLGHLVKIHF